MTPEQKWMIFGIIAGVFVIATIILCIFRAKHPESFTIKMLARIGIFTAFSTILYVVPALQIPLPFFPAFLTIHIDEVPSMLAGFAFGPFVGIATVVCKTLIKLPLTTTMCVGELSDVILSTVYVGVTSWLFNKKRNIAGASIAIGVGTLIQVPLAMVLNVYVLIPFYINLMGFTEEMLLGMMQAAVPAITDVGWSYGILAVLPFNFLKDAIVIILTLVCYRFLRVVLEKMHKDKVREHAAAEEVETSGDSGQNIL